MKKWFSSLILMASICGLMFSVIVPSAVSAAPVVDKCTSSFLGFPAWYRGIIDKETCNIVSPTSDGLSNFIWHIVLNIIEIVMMAVGYITVAYIMYGGFLYLSSVGDPADLVKARKTILNAVIGLVISFAAVVLVNFVSGAITK